jgi:hypothetical protein
MRERMLRRMKEKGGAPDGREEHTSADEERALEKEIAALESERVAVERNLGGSRSRSP